jgi:protein TonB
MPRDLFVQTLTSRPARPRSRWTLLGSLVTHLLVLIALVVLPLSAAIDHPAVPTKLIEFVTPSMPPTPPPPRPERPRDIPPPVNPDAAPPTAGTTIAPEKDIPPLSHPFGPRSSDLPVTSGRVPEGSPGRGVTTLSPPPPRVQPVPIGGQIREPRRLVYAPPVYPTVAQTARIEGIVILEAIIDERGAVRDIRVLRSIPLLDRAAIDAVSRWRYRPTTLNGAPVPVIMTVTVSFKLGSAL